MERQNSKATTAGTWLGIGMGGFIDGILFHQILQWHNLLSNRIPPTTMATIKTNMLWDGIFHACVWAVTLAGIFLLWRAAYRQIRIPSLRSFLGQSILGWGLFNLFEGIIDHHILQIHHVREVANYHVYNLGFLAIGGVLFILAGWLLMKTQA